jgi:hypothetical protein
MQASSLLLAPIKTCGKRTQQDSNDDMSGPKVKQNATQSVHSLDRCSFFSPIMTPFFVQSKHFQSDVIMQGYLENK